MSSTPGSRSTPYPLAVLGCGPAAVSAAREAARREARVALLVPEQATADMPASTDFAQAIRRHQAAQGIHAPALPVDQPRMDIFHGAVRFSRYRTVSVGGVDVRFQRAVIATGAVPGPIELPGAESAQPLRPSELGRLAVPPLSLAVVGDDGSACFWAQQFRRLGSEVHLLVTGPRLLEAVDEQASDIVTRQFAAEGLRVHARCEEITLDRTGNRRGVLTRRGDSWEKLLADEVLVCPAPRPCVAELALETAAVAYSPEGIGVDDWLRTSERRIFSAGGVCGPRFASPEAEEATGRLAARNALAWLPRHLSRCVIPRYTATDPPIVELGLRPAEAVAAGIDTELRRVEFREAQVAGSAEGRYGCIAVLLDRRRRLVGATIVAVGAEDLALPLMLLMQRRLPVHALGELAPCRCGRGRMLAALIRQ